jgi:hypothetical protein
MLLNFAIVTLGQNAQSYAAFGSIAVATNIAKIKQFVF